MLAKRREFPDLEAVIVAATGLLPTSHILQGSQLCLEGWQGQKSDLQIGRALGL